MKATIESQVAEALENVLDPCSIAANAPISIVDMGLVRDWSVDEQGKVLVRMCLTSPLCTMVPHMIRGAETVISNIPGVTSVEVDVDSAIVWSPEEMTRKGRETLDRRRRESLARSPVRPQQWREAATPPRQQGE